VPRDRNEMGEERGCLLGVVARDFPLLPLSPWRGTSWSWHVISAFILFVAVSLSKCHSARDENALAR